MDLGDPSLGLYTDIIGTPSWGVRPRLSNAPRLAACTVASAARSQKAGEF